MSRRAINLCAAPVLPSVAAMTTELEWQDRVGRSWADNYRLTDRSFAGLTERLLGRIADRERHRVLDVGCGAGELSLAVARQRPAAEVLGIDISPDLIAAAQERGAMAANVRFEQADASRWSADGFAPDLVLSRHGVMFFADPAGAFRHLHAQCAAGGDLLFSCFRSASENPWASQAAALLGAETPADPAAPGPFAFADPDRVSAILTAAGWREPEFEEVNFAYIAGMGEDPVADALGFFRQIGPVARALAALEGAERTAAEGWLRDWLEEHRSGDMVAFTAAAWIVSAQH